MKTDYKGIIIPDYLVVMVYLEDGGKCMADINRELGIAYKHLHELKHTFLKLGWANLINEKHRHNIFLTEKGLEIVKISNHMLDTMGFNKAKIMQYIQKSRLKINDDVDVNKLNKEIEQMQNVKN
jgi:hypothetical protein